MANPSSGIDASIYLRSGAELFQGEQQNIPNSGSGSISIFAEGSTNAYDYNYWSSPVSSQGNGLFGISLLHSPASEIVSRPAHLTSALNGSANPLTISTRWIYTFNGKGFSDWNFVGGSMVISPGYGFTMKGTEGKDPVSINGRPNNPGNAQRYDFRGKPNSGIIEVPTNPDTFVLVGNPYPSTFDLSHFLLENSGSGTLNSTCLGNLSRRNVTTGIAYFWDSRENGSSHYAEDYVGGYGAFSPVDPCTDGVYVPPVFKKSQGLETGKASHERYLPVAQGFMVQGVTSGKMIFRNTHRKLPPKKTQITPRTTKKTHEHTGTKTEITRVQLKISVNDVYERVISMAFWDEATAGVDAGMDAEAFQLAPTDVGWLQDGSSYVIDVRPYDILEEIPLFLKIDPNLPKMTFSQENSEKDKVTEIFIVDTQTNHYFSITKEPLTLNLEPGSYHGRFKLAFAEKVSPGDLPAELFEEKNSNTWVSIIQNNHLGELQIKANDLFPVKAVGIFDLQGKKMLHQSNFENKKYLSVPTRDWINGVYIVKVTGMDNRKMIKKISLFNN